MPALMDQNVRAVPADDAGSDSYREEHLLVLPVTQYLSRQSLQCELPLLPTAAEIDYVDYTDYGDDGDDHC